MSKIVTKKWKWFHIPWYWKILVDKDKDLFCNWKPITESGYRNKVPLSQREIKKESELRSMELVIHGSPEPPNNSTSTRTGWRLDLRLLLSILSLGMSFEIRIPVQSAEIFLASKFGAHGLCHDLFLSFFLSLEGLFLSPEGLFLSLVLGLGLDLSLSLSLSFSLITCLFPQLIQKFQFFIFQFETWFYLRNKLLLFRLFP